MELYALILKKLAEWRTFLEEFAELNEDTLPGGLYPAYSRNHIKRPLRENETPFAWINISFNALWLMSTMGLPVTVYPELACGTILKGEAIEGMTDSEIEVMLMGGVMADGVAALRLQERGFASVMGLKVEPRKHDVYEYLTDDPLNGEYAGHVWKIIFKPQAHVFNVQPLSCNARILGEYRTVKGIKSGLATVITETRIGGYIAVFGYEGYESVVSSGRRHQLLSAVDWLSKGKLPVFLHTPSQVVVVPRVTRKGQTSSVMLLNASIDTTQPLSMEIRQPIGTDVELITPKRKVKLVVKKKETSKIYLRIPSLQPWSVVWLNICKRE